MPEIDDATIELLEHRLAGRVTERVQASIFRLYAAVGTGVLTVLGYVAYDAITDAKQAADSYAKLSYRLRLSRSLWKSMTRWRGSRSSLE
jgi:hypothetical protein